jgi:hypothetical protein
MELVYLPSARDDLASLRRHYSRAGLPSGGAAEDLRLARQALTAVVRPRLADGPLPGLREMPLPRTPFRIVLRFTENRIEVLQIRRSG